MDFALIETGVTYKMIYGALVNRDSGAPPLQRPSFGSPEAFGGTGERRGDNRGK